MSLKYKILGSICLIFLSFLPHLAAAGDKLTDSSDAALSWLKYIDEQKFDQSWDQASATFKVTIPKNNWISIMSQVRKPLGRVTSRKVLDQ